MGGVWGHIDSVRATIGISRGEHDNETADTLIHELLHGIVRSMYIEFENKDDEEDVVMKFATGLTTVFKDNPDFLVALQKLLK